MINTVWNLAARFVFFILQLLIPKETNSIVVTTNKGRVFGDNTKSFFLYAKSIPDLNVYLLTKNKALFDSLNSEFNKLFGFVHFRSHLTVDFVSLL